MGENIDYHDLRIQDKNPAIWWFDYEWDYECPFLIVGRHSENQPDMDSYVSSTIHQLLIGKGIEGQEEIRQRLLSTWGTESDIPKARQTIAKHLQEPHLMKRPEAMAYCELLGVSLDYLRCRTEYNEDEGIYSPQHIAEAYSHLYEDQQRAVTALIEQMIELADTRRGDR